MGTHSYERRQREKKKKKQLEVISAWVGFLSLRFSVDRQTDRREVTATGAASDCLWNRRDRRVFDLRGFLFFYLTPTFSSGSLSLSLSLALPLSLFGLVLKSAAHRRVQKAPRTAVCSVLAPSAPQKFNNKPELRIGELIRRVSCVTSLAVYAERERRGEERKGEEGGFDTTTYWRFNPSERGSDASLGPSWALWDFLLSGEVEDFGFPFSALLRLSRDRTGI